MFRYGKTLYRREPWAVTETPAEHPMAGSLVRRRKDEIE
jgi:hypothetical protein